MSLETSTNKQAAPRDQREPIDMSEDETSISDAEKHAGQQDVDGDIEKQATQDLVPSAPVEKPDPNLVVFDGPNDPGNPRNWPVRRRIWITISMGCMTFVVTFSSSVFASALGPVSEEFNIGSVTATLGVALFLLVNFRSNDYHIVSISTDDLKGFVLGPVAFGPASEVWGRRVPLFAG